MNTFLTSVTIDPLLPMVVVCRDGRRLSFPCSFRPYGRKGYFLPSQWRRSRARAPVASAGRRDPPGGETAFVNDTGKATLRGVGGGLPLPAPAAGPVTPAQRS